MRTMVAISGQMDLLYRAISSITEGGIGRPFQLRGSFGSSTR